MVLVVSGYENSMGSKTRRPLGPLEEDLSRGGQWLLALLAIILPGSHGTRRSWVDLWDLKTRKHQAGPEMI
jgi:hypothetical protein